MEQKEVPDAWVDAAMTGAAPGDRGDARFYLANAYELIRQAVLWEAATNDVSMRCFCGRAWFVDMGPDPGHTLHECPAGGDAVIRLNDRELRLYDWHLTELAPLARVPARMQIGGWLREWKWEWSDIYNDALLTYAFLPSRSCDVGQAIHVEVKGYGDGRLFLKVWWYLERK